MWAVTAIGKLGSFAKSHKKGIAVGGAGVGVVSLSIGGLLFLKNIEPIHIMQNLYSSAFGLEERSETRRSTRLFQRILQENRRKLNEAPSGRRQRTGHFITDGIVNARLDKFETAIKAQGYDIKYAPDNGKPRAQRAIALITPDGEEVLDKGFIEGRRKLNQFSDANFARYLERTPKLTRFLAASVPGYKAVKRFEFRSMVRHRAGFDKWYFFDKTRSGVSDLRERLLGGSRDSGEVGGTVDDEGEGDDSQEETDRKNAAQSEIDTGNDAVNEAIQDTHTDVEGGMSKQAAVKKHYSKLIPQGKSLALALVAMGCLAKGYYDQAQDVDLEAYEARIAIAGSGLAALSQHKEGSSYSLRAAEEFVSTYYDDGEQYTQSAAWKEATGQKVTGQEKDADYDYYYYRDGENTVVKKAGQFVSSLGVTAGAVCKVTGNFIVGWIMTAVESITAGSVKAAMAVWGGELGIDWAMQKLLMLLSFPTGIADNGAILNFAELKLSTDLASVEHTRNMGGQQLSEAQISQLQMAYQSERIEADKSKGWYWRYLNHQNPRSLLARITLGLPKTPKGIISSLLQSPRTFLATITSLLAPTAEAETKANKLKDNFGFTDEAIDGIDPILNEEYVVDHLTYYCFPGEPCNTAKQASAERMRTHIICSQYTYYELYVQNEGKDHPECQTQPSEETEAAGIWLLDRNLTAGSNQLSSKRNLSSEMTFELVSKIKACTKLDSRQALFDNGCLAPSAYPANADPDAITPSIFDEPLHIENYADSGDYTGEEITDATFEPSELFNDSTNVKCADGTKNLGIQDGYNDGKRVRIRICAVLNFPGIGAESNNGYGVIGAGGKAVVNARVSGAVYAMAADAKKDGVGLSATSAFRTMAHQQALCPCDGVSVAAPGYSNHQMGIAIDFTGIPKADPAPGTNAAYDWLKKNAAKYGFKEYVNEAWHWSPTGG